MEPASEHITALPWLNDGEDSDNDEDPDRDNVIWPGLDMEERRDAITIAAYFPPHISVSKRWIMDLVRRRACTQCGQAYTEVNNYSLACDYGTHVKGISSELHEPDGEMRALWKCCLRPVDWRIPGCVAADHTDEHSMRRLRPDTDMYHALPQCLWFAINHDNRSVLTSTEHTTAPGDKGIRDAYAADPNTAVGHVSTLVVVRFDWRKSARLRAEAEGRL